MIYYVSTINIDDTVRLKQENIEISKILPQYFKGIRNNNEFIIYRAFNKVPDSEDESFRSYGFVEKLASVQ